VQAGPAAELLEAEGLSRLFGFPLQALTGQGAAVFAPQW
jgi:hypothetical protein